MDRRNERYLRIVHITLTKLFGPPTDTSNRKLSRWALPGNFEINLEERGIRGCRVLCNADPKCSSSDEVMSPNAPRMSGLNNGCRKGKLVRVYRIKFGKIFWHDLERVVQELFVRFSRKIVAQKH